MRRNSLKHKEWRKAVRKRDGNKCCKCSIGEELNVHHKEGWALRPDLRYTISNGITLCARCHYLFHEIFMGGARNSSNTLDTRRFLVTFDVLQDHPINGNIFKRYLRRRSRTKRRYKKKS